MTFLAKDGITVEMFSPVDIAKLKGLGYAEVKEEKPAAPEAKANIVEDQQAIVEEAIQLKKKVGKS